MIVPQPEAAGLLDWPAAPETSMGRASSTAVLRVINSAFGGILYRNHAKLNVFIFNCGKYCIDGNTFLGSTAITKMFNHC